MRVLVVEDQPDLLRALADDLQAHGHAVTACADAESAWAAWQRDPFPLAFFDLTLPGEDGLSLCARIRQTERGATSVILFITGSVDPSVLDDLIAAGADDYLPKPLRWEQFHIRLAFAERRAAKVVAQWFEHEEHIDQDIRFTAFMNHSPAAAWVKDDHGRYVYVNAAFERAYSMKRDALIGKRDRELWQADAIEFEINDQAVLASDLAIDMIETVTAPDGPVQHWLSTKFPIKDAAGRRFVAGTAIEVTKRQQAEHELARERELLQTLIDHVPDCLYAKDRSSRFIRMNRATATLLGLADPADGIGMTDAAYFPETLARKYATAEAEVMETRIPVIDWLEPLDAEQTIWGLNSTVPLVNANGEVTGIVGVTHDVTERQRLEESIRKSEERQRALLAAIPDLIFRFDQYGTHLDVKSDPRGSLGRPAGELIGQPMSELLPPEPESLALQAITRALATGQLQVVEIEAEVEGAQRRFEARIVPCGGDEVLAIARDVTEQRVLEERLTFQAAHDPLTGLLNRATLEVRLQHALDRSANEGRRVALLFIDLDDFKQANDTFGHETGDQLLVEIAGRLRTWVRETDAVARLGGDEFAVLMENVRDRREVNAMAERLRTALAQPMRIGTRGIQSRASVGIAMSRPGRTNPTDLLKRADIAMYAEKRAGKSELSPASHSA